MMDQLLYLLQLQELQSTNQFQVQTNNDTTATNLKNTINGHADFLATVSSTEVTVTRATVGNENLTNVSI